MQRLAENGAQSAASGLRKAKQPILFSLRYSRKSLSKSARMVANMSEGTDRTGWTRVVTNLKIDRRDSLPRLSKRQEDCLRGVLELKSAKQIARDLGISPGGVEKHLKNCRVKLGVDTTAEAARLFFGHGMGRESPQWGFSHLVTGDAVEHQGAVLERQRSDVALEDRTGAQTPDQPLSPRQTLLTIGAVSFFSIVGLLLLVACADGIRTLVVR